MELKSPIFDSGDTIPEENTCKGKNISPELSWNGAPAGTKSFALIAEDPDAPSGTYTHWVVYNIPVDKASLPSGLPPDEHPDGVMQGKNDFGKTGYGGPCPPQGDGPHRYYFKVFALDTMLELQPGADKIDLKNTMDNHILDQAELMGRYEVK